MAGSDDELARTELPVSADDAQGHTQTSPSSRPAPAPELGKTLGRYKLETTLGEGGMGVVHAAFDPDLERRVALKVLRAFDDNNARQRLLREARAMARLTHANVVTVHEVGSASGRDYVAMELVEGKTLVDWLRESTDEREIVAAFIAAGRGLAAAHSAGLVHRDFKPHNVLVGTDGRVRVTDFGLARGVDAVNLALETTLDVSGPATSAHTPSSLSGLTATGSVLGTPAYMSPEQWTGGTVGPAADQFAFCVALWEALAKERPFRGQTIEQLKAEVARGPAKLDTSKLPRRLRGALCRGLDPDPARRWPNMDALLATLSRSQRRPGLALAIGGGAVVIAAGVYLVMRGGGGVAAGPTCEPPAQEPDVVWSAKARESLAGRVDLTAAFERDVAAWRTARAQACKAPVERRGAQLACLDGVLARLDAVRGGVASLPGEVTDKGIEALVDPAVCMTAMPPRLALRSTPDTTAALAMLIDGKRAGTDAAVKEDAIVKWLARPNVDPCARAVALHAITLVSSDQPRSKAALLDSINAAEACGDERIRAESLLEEAPFEFERPVVGARGRAALEKAKIAVDRVAQPDLVAEIDQERSNIAAQDEHWDEAFAASSAAGAGFGLRGRVRAQLGNVGLATGLLFRRNNPGDMERVRAEVAKWKPVAEQLHDDHHIATLERQDAYARLFLGDDRGAHADIVKLWKPHPLLQSQKIDGVVVDQAGKPLAGVTVAAGTQVFFDSIGPLPFGASGDGNLRLATTDANGAFSIPDAPVKGAIAAQLDPKHRSIPYVIAPHLRLVIAPTRKIAGHVRLGSLPRTRAFVIASVFNENSAAFLTMATIRGDDSFEMEGAPSAAVKLGVTSWSEAASANITFSPLPAGTADKADVVLDAPNTARTLDVIVRSTVNLPFDTAQVFTVPGKLKLKSIMELTDRRDLKGIQVRFARTIVGESIPKRAIGKTRAGDVIAHFTDVTGGELTVCVIGLNGDISDPAVGQRLQNHLKELESTCVNVGADEDAIVVETAPQKRFD